MGEAKLMFRKDIEKLHRADPMAIHSVIIGIQQQNIPELTEILYDVSDPRSKNYGKHWTKQQVDDFTANHQAVEAVTAYLQANHIEITDRTINNDYFIAQAPVATWEKVLDCQFHKYEITSLKKTSRKDSTVFIRTEAFSLPHELANHVMGIYNTIDFPFPSVPDAMFRDRKEAANRDLYDAMTFAQEKKAMKDASTPYLRGEAADAPLNPSDPSMTIHFNDSQFLIDGYVTPQLLSTYYNVSNTIVSPCNVTQGLLEGLDSAVSPQDLTMFQETFKLLVQPIAEDINGHVTNQACNQTLYEDCYESNLDVQYMMAMSQNVPTSYYYDPQSGTLTWMPWVVYLSNLTNPDTVYSISYCTYELYITESVATAWDINAIKLGIMGSTIFSAAGDDGAVGFMARNGPEYCGYFPMYPASSPFVTAVGGTQGPEKNNPEIGCMSFSAYITSGGGFSNLYAQPPYQTNAVNQYFDEVDGTAMEPYFNATETYVYGFYLATGYYNRSGRAYPDISLLAHSYIIVVNQNFTPVDGTSASTPVMASLTNIINNARKQANMSTMGFLNPFLYAYGSYFANDITVGANHCSAYSDRCCIEGFNVTTGWDPMTGIGSLDFPKYYNTAMNLPVTTDDDSVNPIPTGNDDDSSSNSLSAGAIAGIVIGVIVGTGLLIGLGVFVYFRFVKSATLGENTIRDPLVQMK